MMFVILMSVLLVFFIFFDFFGREGMYLVDYFYVENSLKCFKVVFLCLEFVNV